MIRGRVRHDACIEWRAGGGAHGRWRVRTRGRAECVAAGARVLCRRARAQHIPSGVAMQTNRCAGVAGVRAGGGAPRDRGRRHAGHQRRGDREERKDDDTEQHLGSRGSREDFIVADGRRGGTKGAVTLDIAEFRSCVPIGPRRRWNFPRWPHPGMTETSRPPQAQCLVLRYCIPSYSEATHPHSLPLTRPSGIYQTGQRGSRHQACRPPRPWHQPPAPRASRPRPRARPPG